MKEQLKNKQEQEKLKTKDDFDNYLKSVSKKFDSWDKRIFDTGYEIAEKFLDEGYARAWFSWLEWLTLTSALLAIGIKAKSIIVLFFAFGSGILLFFIGLVYANRVLSEYISKGKLKRPYYYWVLIVVSFSVPGLLIKLLTEVLMSVFFK